MLRLIYFNLGQVTIGLRANSTLEYRMMCGILACGLEKLKQTKTMP